MYNFDKTDVKIVNLLLEDGRMSSSEIARRIGDISERAVRYRIDRMMDENVIRVSAVAKPQAFGLTTIADVWMEVESDRILEVAKKMVEFDNVSYVACGIGESDVSIQIVAKDTAEIYQFITEVVRKVPGVRKTTTSIVPLILKDVYQWRVPERIVREISEKEIPAITDQIHLEEYMFGAKTHALQKRAQEILPLGVNSNFRYWGDGITPYVEKAKGAYLWDVDGTKYIDYRMAFGPIILGHSYDEVDQKVIEEIQRGILFAMTGELEIAVAEMISDMAPAVEMVRMACSGTEATMHAIRVARAYTGRDLILKFEGNYHGFHDHTLWSTYAPVEAYGNARSPIPVPASSGIPKSMREFIITLPFNDFEGFERVMRSYGEQIAAVITEPCQGNCAAINPQEGFLELIRKKTEEYGCVFILDEVKTGFRIANGGAQEYYRIKPDLVTYAKALGNGYPVAAFGGKREIMSIIGHGVAQGGTYTNNKPGIAAAYATLKLLKEKPVLKTIAKRGQRLMDGLKDIFEDNDIPVVMTGYPAMFSFSLGIEAVACQREWAKSDHDMYLKLVEKSIERGVMPDFDSREPWFLCYEHSDADVDETLNVYAEIVKEVKK